MRKVMGPSVIFCCLLSIALSQKLFIGDQVLRITAENEERFASLRRQYDELQQDMELDLWSDSVRGSQMILDMHIPFSRLQPVKTFLSSQGIQYDIMIEDIQAHLDKEMEAVAQSSQRERETGAFDYGSYHTLEQIYDWMDSLVAGNPELLSKMTIGESYEKRPLHVLKYSLCVTPNVQFSTGSNRTAIWMDSGIHAREWISPAVGIWTAKKLVTEFGQDPPVTMLLNKMDIFLLIVVNPDGYAFTHTSNRMWRKTRSISGNSSCIGVDPNRNWEADFGGPGSNKDPCSETFSGTFAHSESEVKAIVDFILDHGNFKAMVTIHSYSQKLMYPYGHSYSPVPNAEELHLLAKRAVDALKSLYGTKYSYGSMISTIYPASGTMADWGYLNGLKYSYTVELRDTGHYGFLLPASQIIPTAQETWLALLTIMEHVRDHPY